MALSLAQTDALSRILKPGMSIASYGYPDLIAPEGLLKKIIDKPVLIRKDSAEICKRHGLREQPIPDAHSFFEAAGCTLDVYDIIAERGSEIYCDLNVSRETFCRYDVVLDVGTAEHCFNIGQALINMAQSVKIGGIILHENPANWCNHGFYNLNPTLFFDFYDQNGFEVEDLRLVTRDGRYAKADPVRRFKFPNEEVNIFCRARRLKEQVLIYPTQTKYKKLPTPGTTGERDADEWARRTENG